MYLLTYFLHLVILLCAVIYRNVCRTRLQVFIQESRIEHNNSPICLFYKAHTKLVPIQDFNCFSVYTIIVGIQLLRLKE